MHSPCAGESVHNNKRPCGFFALSELVAVISLPGCLFMILFFHCSNFVKHSCTGRPFVWFLAQEQLGGGGGQLTHLGI